MSRKLLVLLTLCLIGLLVVGQGVFASTETPPPSATVTIPGATLTAWEQMLSEMTTTANALLPIEERWTKTPTKTSDEILPLDWPVKAPSREQISEARHCDILALVKERNAATLDNPMAVGQSLSACDWAVVARAYLERLPSDDSSIPVEAKKAFFKAVTLNPALAFNDGLLFRFHGAFPTVNLPPFASLPISRIDITLDWGGGLEVPIYEFEYTLTITKADTDIPLVSGSRYSKVDKSFLHPEDTPVPPNGRFTAKINKDLIQALGASLTDLMPINNFAYFDSCSDNYPDWHVTITFKKGPSLQLITKGSNWYFGGAPFQTTIENQKYMQYSGQILFALLDITNSLELPRASTEGMTCGPPYYPFDLVYGVEATATSKKVKR